MSYVELSALDLALAALLLVVNGAISLAFGLRLERASPSPRCAWRCSSPPSASC